MHIIFIEQPDPPFIESAMDITLRDATEADLPAILAIYNESVPTGRATADTAPVALADRLEWFRKFTPEKRPIWIAVDADKPVGVIYLSSFYGGRPAYDKTAEISFYIAASHQRKGLGTFLTQRMIEACPRLGITTLIAMHFDHNDGTKNLIRNFGFETVGHLPEIAEVFGAKRGLLISILRVPAEIGAQP